MEKDKGKSVEGTGSNGRHAVYYQANKEKINARRRELYAERVSKKRKVCDDKSDPRTLVLPKVVPCRHCGAHKFYKETSLFCCSGGDVKLVDSVLPDSLVSLVTGDDSRSREFHSMIRTYNNNFAFTSIGIHCDGQFERRDNGIYTVRVQGKVYHFLGDLLPSPGVSRLSGLQIYMYDPEHQVSNMMDALPRFDRDIVQILVGVMSGNPYSAFLKSLSALEGVEDYHIVIRSDPGLDQRGYNRPTSSEVTAIWMENEDGEGTDSARWDIRVYTKSGGCRNVCCYFGCYDPLQYVLMFPNGEPGWHGGIPKVGARYSSQLAKNRAANGPLGGCVTFEELVEQEQQGVSHAAFADTLAEQPESSNRSTSTRRRTVSFREYYVYKLQIRPNDRSFILRFGRLFQQYVVDNYIKIETMRLEFFKRNQKKFRREHYQGIMDSVIGGVQRGGKVGTRTYLLVSFIGGPRDMRNRYLDSMALVMEFGKPDIFLTVTCNPNWPEIKEMLKPGEEAHNRPDLTARVFKSKLAIMTDRISSGRIFGKPSSVVHVVEFQKRGLPHAHFLIILKPEFKYLTPEAYDRIVSAEIPDREADPYLFNLVVQHMMHGPCGVLNPQNVCMREGLCKNHYPTMFAEHTTHGKWSYPVYRCRDNGKTATVRRNTLDNRWVIPYNPALLAEFACHINVEICCDIRAVKYLYKYIHKGHDKVSFRIASDDDNMNVNEISNFQDARWVSPVETTWRIFGFTLNGMNPVVIQLQLHLPNYQSIQFEDDDDLQDILQNERLKRTMLTEFFVTNATDPDARQLNLLYKEFPMNYVWDSQARRWTRRHQRKVIGILCTVSPIETERYYLRVLLNVRCPASYDDLLMYEGVFYNTFREAAHRRGLLHDDADIDNTLEDASVYRMASEMRRLFATVLHYCRPEKPQVLFLKYYEFLAEDFTRTQAQTNMSDDDILRKVLQGLNDTLEAIGRDVNEFRLVSFSYIATQFERFTREIAAEKNIPVPEEHLQGVHQLNPQQREAFNIIFSKAIVGSGGMFFIDGPGGTGKSFLYKVLLAHIRSRGDIGLVVASSGIASSEFLGRRKAHSRFKIPIDCGPNIKCNIAFQSSEAELIRTAKIIIWDEASMANKSVIQAVDKLLQEVCETTASFGGKLVVFGGDFRQVLPIVKAGTRFEQIEASLVSSDLWKEFTKIKLTENIRARTDPEYVEFLMRIGNGQEPTNRKGQIEIPRPMLIPYISVEESVESLIKHVYPDIYSFESRPFEMMQRTILCPKNEFVDDINNKLIHRLPGKEMTYVSDDRAKYSPDQGDYVDYLNSLEPAGMPQHILTLKENCPVMLLRNINPVEGLCNGTRLICKHLTPNLVGAIIATGQFRGKHVWIPKIPLETNSANSKYMVSFVRRQLPLRLCFAMSINKAQGQTLDYVGIYLKQPIFNHGQLYVGLSRVKTSQNIRLLILPPTCQDPETTYITNVVYNEILVKASFT